MINLIYLDLMHNPEFKNFAFNMGDTYVSYAHKSSSSGYSSTLVYYDESRKDWAITKPTTKLEDTNRRGSEWIAVSIHEAVAFKTTEVYMKANATWNEIMPIIYESLRMIDAVYTVRAECEESYKKVVDAVKAERERVKNLICFKVNSQGALNET